MLFTSSAATLTKYEGRANDGNYYRLTDYMGTFQRPGTGPQAIFHELNEAGAVIPPHFHRTPEFQVFLRGKLMLDGRVIRHRDAQCDVGALISHPDDVPRCRV